MATSLNPYLTFPGTAREAMEHYKQVLGGELTVSTFGEFGDPSAPGADGVMHAQLVSPAGTLMAADPPPGQSAGPAGSSVSVSLFGEDAEDLRRWWAGLSEGGTVTMPLERQVWGDEFGMCVDRFGTSWMVNIVAPKG